MTRATALLAAMAAVALAAPLGTALAQNGESAAARARAKTRLDAGPGKPVAPLTIEHRLTAAPALGRPLEIVLEVRADAPLANVAVTLTVPAELAVAAGPVVEAAALAAGETLTATVVVTPLAPGTFFAAVLAEGDVGGLRQARSVAIAVDVPVSSGAAAPEAPAAAEPAGRGQAIHSLPAEERTR